MLQACKEAFGPDAGSSSQYVVNSSTAGDEDLLDELGGDSGDSSCAKRALLLPLQVLVVSTAHQICADHAGLMHCAPAWDALIRVIMASR